jgi:hypothetical protein
MERFLQETAFQADYHEQLAHARAEAERAFLLKVLAEKEVQNRSAQREAGSSVLLPSALESENAPSAHGRWSSSSLLSII